MERKYKYHQKNILIIGLAETGRSIARFLIKRECKVLFFDDNHFYKKWYILVNLDGREYVGCVVEVDQHHWDINST